jgi:hypothetical protein
MGPAANPGDEFARPRESDEPARPPIPIAAVFLRNSLRELDIGLYLSGRNSCFWKVEKDDLGCKENCGAGGLQEGCDSRRGRRQRSVGRRLLEECYSPVLLIIRRILVPVLI